jgi:PAS domain S-box-containing protein
LRELRRIVHVSRRTVAVGAAACLVATTLVVGLTARGEDVGSVVFIPWVAVLAFEFGAVAGGVIAAIALTLFLVPAGLNGTDLTVLYVLARAVSFGLIGVGVGLMGARLREEERTTRTLVEGLPLVTYVESLERGLTYVGPQIEPLTGYSVREWLHTPGLWRKSLHPDDTAQVIAAHQTARETFAPFEVEYRLCARDGTVVWVSDRSTAIDQRGQPYRQGFIVDITAQKLAEEQRVRSGALMRGLVDSTVDGIALTDRAGEIVIANAPMGRLAARLEIPGEGPIHERLLAIAERTREPERFVRRMHELADNPDSASFDEFELADRRVFQGFTAPVVGKDGMFLGRVWTLRDLTEQRELDRLREAFVGNVSHELRTPLTSISGYVELLQTGSDRLTAEQAGFLEVIRRNTGRLQEIVNDLLFVAQLDAGRLSLEQADTDLGELAHQAVEAARPAADAKQLTLTLEQNGSAPIVGDASRLNQVLDNLISNAIKFTPEGGTISVAVEPTVDATIVRVTDTGMGIPRDEQARLFERFFRSTAASTGRIPGTGLGLSITRAIVEGHEGSISVESEEGKGTSFAVRLPNRPGEAGREPQPDQSR